MSTATHMKVDGAPDGGELYVGAPPTPTASPLATLYGDAEFADVTLVAVPDDGGEVCASSPPSFSPATPPRPGSAPARAPPPTAFPAHRAVLAAASPYFRSMFASCMMESKPGARVPLVGVPPDCLGALLRFCYAGGVAVPRRRALALAALADRLDVPSLRTALATALDADLASSAAVAAEYVAAAAAAGRDDVVDRCLDALAGEWATAAAAPSFGALDEGTLAVLLARDDLCAASEGEIARALLTWGAARAGRAGAVDLLAARVRWGAVPPADLAALATHPAVRASPVLRDYALRGFVSMHGKPAAAPPRPVALLPSPDGSSGPSATAPSDDVALPPRGGPAARLRLRAVLTGASMFPDCPWPATATTPCPPDRPCACAPAPGGPQRGLPVVVSREATVAALKARAARDAGVPPAAAAAAVCWDFYSNTKFGHGPLAETARCAEVDLRDGQAVLLELK